MKKILAFFLVLSLFVVPVGCVGTDVDVQDPQTQLVIVSIVRTATAVYLEKNDDAAGVIIDLNYAVQSMEYGLDVYTYSYVNLKNKIIRTGFTEDMTLAEKEGCLFMVDLVFSLVMQEFQADQFYLVEPESLDMIKILFSNAAEVAELYGVEKCYKK